MRFGKELQVDPIPAKAGECVGRDEFARMSGHNYMNVSPRFGEGGAEFRGLERGNAPRNTEDYVFSFHSNPFPRFPAFLSIGPDGFPSNDIENLREGSLERIVLDRFGNPERNLFLL